MSTHAIELKDVSLCYRLAKQRLGSFKEYMLHWVRGALSYEDLWALRDVSFSLERGESLGIVGRNGAGKSSLLRVVSGVLRPTRGSVSVNGRIAPLLELGVGFDSELTGRENIFLSALLLGHSRREIRERLDAIIDFSGIADFIDTPVRNYSSGMLARLSFSILTAWTPDILLLDEFLGVGDAGFVQKCHERMERFLSSGTTMLFISHSAEEVRERCRRAIWLEAGRIVAAGPVNAVLDRYVEHWAASGQASAKIAPVSEAGRTAAAGQSDSAA
jgi:ABC-type polysaccharide/polyol phosphate transport system ATPase subunit